MKSKLTLSVDKDLVQFARKEARTYNKSVSSIFSEYLLHRKAQLQNMSVPSIVSMVGSLKAYNIDDTKQAIRDSYAEKYSR